jgi:cation diffusion facilitator CzcD-associated flavoprotein CzcO
MIEELPHHEVAIVGTGFAGLGMAIRMRQEGIEDFVVLERASTLGGTWRDNHYPGCACDVPSPLYSFSFAPNPRWSHMYAHSDEIRAYMEECADRYGVRPHIHFDSEFTGARWDGELQRWTVSIGGVPALRTRFLVGGFGGLNRPTFPEIDALESFEGPVFHSAQWDHSVQIEGKRIGVIGTGASAIQLVPQVAKRAGHVTVFQRTPAWVLPKADRPITDLEKRLYARVPAVQKAIRTVIFGITEALALGLTRRPEAMRGPELLSRAYMRAVVKDEGKRRALTPDYRLGCKRILFSNDYFAGVARENVSIDTAGIARVTPAGVITADGELHELDALVCGTGFAIEEVFTGLDLHGEHGVSLQDAWAGGIEAHRGTTVAGFPNAALLSGPNTGTGSTSQVYMIESQIEYVLQMIGIIRARGVGAIAVRPEAQAASNADLQRRMQRTVWLRGGCKSWYLDEQGVNRTLWPGTATEYRNSIRALAEDEYLLEPARGPAAQPVATAVA